MFSVKILFYKMVSLHFIVFSRVAYASLEKATTLGKTFRIIQFYEFVDHTFSLLMDGDYACTACFIFYDVRLTTLPIDVAYSSFSYIVLAYHYVVEKLVLCFLSFHC